MTPPSSHNVTWTAGLAQNSESSTRIFVPIPDGDDTPIRSEVVCFSSSGSLGTVVSHSLLLVRPIDLVFPGFIYCMF